MKTIVIISATIYILSFSAMNEATGQWAANGNNIYNTNAGNVGIGNSSPTTLLYVAKNMSEPAITVRNQGGAGGATFSMVDDASGAGWKFKATNSGGFKIRDNANSLDVLTFEANSFSDALYINGAGSLGMGTNIPAASAALEINSTTLGFLPPRMTSQQIAMVSNPANGLVVYNTSDEHLYSFSVAANAWKRMAYNTETIIPFICGSSYTFIHTAGNVAPVTKTVTYGTVMTDLSGSDKCWITQNLGADHQASSADDAAEASAGWYWQFNRLQGYKHDGTTVTPAWTITWIDENIDWLPENDPCASLLFTGWRVPTYSEWYIADNHGWDNYNETYASELRLHAAGQLAINDGSLQGRGVGGTYWSSQQNASYFGNYLYFDSSTSTMAFYSKAYARSIRCILD